MPLIPLIMPVPRAKDGREPKVSDTWHPDVVAGRKAPHKGNDVMFRRNPNEPAALPQGSQNYYIPDGTPAVAAADGVVVTSEEIGTGGLVRIQHTPQVRTGYFHLTNRQVSVGQQVRAGTVVGTVGHNPLDYPLNHLHFEVYENGNAVDPGPYLAGASSIPMPILIGVGLLGAVLIGGVAFYAYTLWRDR
jgi:murein DD-endopeptidase MepM/ murein hydrolase activator NlpD